MINLNKQRIAVYAYFSTVFTLIFGLSFAVKGDKITGSFILETAGNLIGSISLFFVPVVVFGFLLSLAFSFFIIRHAQEIKKEVKPEKTKFFAAVVVLLLSVSFISFGLYFENSEGKITGQAIGDAGSTDVITIKLEKIIEDIGGKEPIYTQYRELFNGEWQERQVQGDRVVSDWKPSLPGFSPQRTQTEPEQKEKAVKDLAYQATWQLLDLTLGQFAFGYVEDYCKEQYDSSDYPGSSNNPLSYNSNPGNSFTGQGNFQQATSNCIGNQTTVTAQARRSIISTAFTYQTSWTITPCRENVQYNIYLANSIDDRIGIASGIANKGIAKSESNHFSYAKSYQFICIWNSDGTIGDNGYACFNVV